MHYREKINSSPDIMLGKPVINNTRIAVELILKKLSEGANITELPEAYPQLTKEEVIA